MSPSRRAFARSLTALPALARTIFAKPTSSEPYTIVIAANAAEAEVSAARELQVYLKFMSGLEPAITEKTGPGPVIRIGTAAEIDAPAGEGFALLARNGSLSIRGGTPRGSLYGVYAFLERLGCRWYTEDIASIPKLPAFAIRDFHDRQSPAFEYREAFFTEAQGKEWSVRNRLNGHFHQLDASTGGRHYFEPFAHSFSDIAPPNQYFAAHPEYYALVEGRRRPQGQLCLTNANVVRLAIDRAKAWAASSPDAAAISIAQNDGAPWCQCEPCSKALAEEGGAMSGVLLRFVNQVAAALPDRRVDTLAYMETLRAPSKTVPSRNVIVRVCPIDACQSHGYQACPQNRDARQALLAWAKIAHAPYLWQYSANFSHILAPFPNFRALEADIKLAHSLGYAGVFVQGAGSGGARTDDAELRSYITARLLWNPGTNVARETRAFLDAVYGPASPPMRQYFELQQKLTRPADKHLWFDQDIPAPYLTDDYFRTGRALLFKAAELATTPAARQRIERRGISLDYLETVAARRFHSMGDTYEPDSATAAQERIKNLGASALKLGLTQFREDYPIQRQVADWTVLTQSFPTAHVAAKGYRLTLVPALEGRLISLQGPPSDAQLVRVPSPGEWGYPRAGGVYARLHTDRFGPAVEVAWSRIDNVRDGVVMIGTSANGLAIALGYAVTDSGVRCRFAARNPGNGAVPAALRWTAELPTPTSARHRPPLTRWSDELQLSPGETLTLDVELAAESASLTMREPKRKETSPELLA